MQLLIYFKIDELTGISNDSAKYLILVEDNKYLIFIGARDNSITSNEQHV